MANENPAGLNPAQAAFEEYRQRMASHMGTGAPREFPFGLHPMGGWPGPGMPPPWPFPAPPPPPPGPPRSVTAPPLVESLGTMLRLAVSLINSGLESMAGSYGAPAHGGPCGHGGMDMGPHHGCGCQHEHGHEHHHGHGCMYKACCCCGCCETGVSSCG